MNGTEEKSRRPEDTPFKQQRLKAWQPILTPNWVIGTFALVGLIFIPIGIVLHMESENVVEYSVQYDGKDFDPNDALSVRPVNSTSGNGGCFLKDENDRDSFNLTQHGCFVTFTIEKDMKAPVFVYYQLDNFYQNHRRYVQSRSDGQLRGDMSASTTDCKPMTGYTGLKYASLTDSEPVNGNWTLNPCGLIANSLFNDIFWINSYTTTDSRTYYQSDNSPDDSSKTVVNMLDQSDIAWKSDVGTKFNNPDAPNDPSTTYLWQNPKYRYIIPGPDLADPVPNKTAWTTKPTSFGVKNEHFIVWMRTAGLPSFRKLYGRINQDLKAGSKLEFLVSSNFLVNTFDGKKSLVISTTSWFGGRNPFLGIAYIVVGSLCMVLAILFFAKHKLSPRKLGDTRYLVWKNNH
ncbi:TPA: hypothetical protein N0F65_005856 [Lagenidium giganteum]|uniref:Cell cycle control protein n=1 Tax=Lagenidium giganteum TaxID=4803 RepID=A0AAV2YQL8_9STRA|nr:TPA: hypothetical protein N0F65_005856 [Lagenidium giganteum]